jgi:polyphosphate kinase
MTPRSLAVVATRTRHLLAPAAERPPADTFTLDRDLSSIAFQRRVLEEATDERNPLLERVKFLSILGSNIEEFAMTRLGELRRAPRAAATPLDNASRSPVNRLARVEKTIRALYSDAISCLQNQIEPALAEQGIHILDYPRLQPGERAEVDAYFLAHVLPLLMPAAVDSKHPFPHIATREFALAVTIGESVASQRLAIVRVPNALPALIPVRCRRAATCSGVRAAIEIGFVWADQLIKGNLSALFPGMPILSAHLFQVMRDAALRLAPVGDTVLPDCIEHGVRRRPFADVVAITVSDSMPQALVASLAQHLRFPELGVRRIPVLKDVRGLRDLVRLDRPELRYPRLVQRRPAEFCRPEGRDDFFSAIRERDVFLHHPFDSFEPVVQLFRQAARDPDVLAISATLYRVDRKSPILAALVDAARAGKEVRVIVELRARFDEAHNATCARALQTAGAHVSYGMAGLKVHAKTALVVRREADGTRRYAHISSGNYHVANARAYTDFGLLTCDEDLCRDVADLFNVLSGCASPTHFRTLLVAPYTLRSRLHQLIEECTALHQNGTPGRMILKMNALTDETAAQSLLRASQAGVRVDLIVRGICCLRPGVPGASDNIHVRSIVGRFLEHSRAWHFQNGQRETLYMGSADLRSRNLDRRIEVMAPVTDPMMVARIRDEVLEKYLADTEKAWRLTNSGTYERLSVHHDRALRSSQEEFMTRTG